MVLSIETTLASRLSDSTVLGNSFRSYDGYLVLPYSASSADAVEELSREVHDWLSTHTYTGSSHVPRCHLLGSYDLVDRGDGASPRYQGNFVFDLGGDPDVFQAAELAAVAPSLSASLISDVQVQVTATAAIGDPAHMAFEWGYRTSATATTLAGSWVTGTSTGNIGVFTGLTPGTEYDFRARVVHWGVGSDWDLVTITTDAGGK